jgi:hypothetical protein
VSSTHPGPKTRSLLLLVCQCGAPSLTRGRVCRLQLLLAFASAVILGSESRGTHNHTLPSSIRDTPNLEGQVPVFISPRNRVGQLYPQVRYSATAAVQSPISRSLPSNGSTCHNDYDIILQLLNFNICNNVTTPEIKECLNM